MKPVNLMGRTFGRLGVVRKVERRDLRWPQREASASFWSCACECGATCVVRGSHLLLGNTTSCGCFRSERVSTRNARRWERHPRPPSINRAPAEGSPAFE